MKGDTGAQGAAGPQGAQGIQGLLGATGPQGSQGSAGPQGEKGETGASGAQGTTGPRGPQGDGFHYRGEFDPNGTYASWDVVVFGGSSYLATAQTNGAPGSDPSWTLLVSKGDTGAPGATGGQGPQGPQGVQGVKGDTGATGGQGPQGPAGANGGSVTVAAGAPAITCSGGGVTVTDALQNTQYVCDGRQGPQGPQGAQGPTGSTTLIAQTVINPTAFNFPLSNCCNTDWVVDVPGAPPGTPPVTLPNSIFKNVLTSGGALLIQATFPIWSNSGAIVFCQPNIDNHWAGATLGSASADYIFNFGSTTKVTATISRVYQVPAGVHTFSLGCAANLIGVSLPQGGVLSYSVFELH